MIDCRVSLAWFALACCTTFGLSDDDVCTADSCVNPRTDDRTALEIGVADPTIEKFNHWLQESCGTETQNVYIGDFEHGGKQVRGLGAVRGFADEELLFCVKRECWISDHALLERLKPMEEKCHAVPLVAVVLAEELLLANVSEGPSTDARLSHWKPWFDVLPTEADYKSYHPSYLRGEGHSVHESIDAWKNWHADVARCYKKAYRSLPTAVKVPKSYLRLAATLSFSRRFPPGMIPLIDMANSAALSHVNLHVGFPRESHRPLQRAFTESDVDPTKFCAFASRDIKAGEELFADYNAEAYPAYHFFSSYGFAHGPEVHASRVEECKMLQHAFPADASGPIVLNYKRFIADFCHE